MKFLLSIVALFACVQCSTLDQASIETATSLSLMYQERVETVPFIRDAELDDLMDRTAERQKGRGRVTAEAWGNTNELVDAVQDFLEENPEATSSYRQVSSDQIEESFNQIVRIERTKGQWQQ